MSFILYPIYNKFHVLLRVNNCVRTRHRPHKYIVNPIDKHFRERNGVSLPKSTGQFGQVIFG